MKVMLLSSLLDATGNNTTILRLKHFIEAGGNQGVLGDVNKSTEELLFLSQDVDCAIGLHAFHSGKHLRKFSIPFIIILGGTGL